MGGDMGEFDWGTDEENVLFSRQKALLETAASTFNAEDRTVDVVMTTPVMDRDEEIVQPKAFEETIGNFKDNPIVLFNHKAFDEPPIGTVLPDSISISEKAMEGTIQFRPKGRSKLADKVADAVEDGVLTKVSIGFKVKGIEEKQKGDRSIVVITKADLVELSVVSVPSNPQARIKSTTVERLKSHLELMERAAFAGEAKTKDHVFYRPNDIDVLHRAQTICKRMQDVYAAEQFMDERELEAVHALREMMSGFAVLTEEAAETKGLGELEGELDRAFDWMGSL